VSVRMAAGCGAITAEEAATGADKGNSATLAGAPAAGDNRLVFRQRRHLCTRLAFRP